jgi:hypothetical protein
VNAKQGFRDFQAARRTIQGYEAVHMIRKGRFDGWQEMICLDRSSSSTISSIWQPEHRWGHATICLRLKVATLPRSGEDRSVAECSVTISTRLRLNFRGARLRIRRHWLQRANDRLLTRSSAELVFAGTTLKLLQVANYLRRAKDAEPEDPAPKPADGRWAGPHASLG